MTCLELDYKLAELPSAQHRAGLAGLVLMVRELQQQPWFFERDNPVVEFISITEYSATLKLNLEGLKALFDLTYKASKEERATETKIKKYDRIEEFEVQDKKGKTKLKKRYIYSVVVPYGAFLPVWDKSSDEQDKGLWIKLWRDMLWNIIRGVPATRNSFNNRCDGQTYSQDAEKLWQELKNPKKKVGQSGNYFLGAMASNAENVPTKDLVKYQFILHFWVFVAQVYCPMSLDKDGKRQFLGYAIAVPDVANLVDFCDEFQGVLEARESQKFGYLPREAVIDIPEEGALDLLRLLKQRISRETGSQTLEDLILGVELIHAEKVGNNVKIRSISYVEPIVSQIDRFAEIQNAYWCPWFRKQRLLNLIRDKPAWYEFDDLLSRTPIKWLNKEKKTEKGIDKSNLYFSHDAQAFFRIEIFNQDRNKAMTQKIRDTELIVYKVCQSYVLSKLKSKHKMEWQKGKDQQNGYPRNSETKSKIKQSEYNEKKSKIANEAFLAVRSRTEKQSFIDYFVSSLYPFIKEEEFAQFARELFDDRQWQKIRALTLLALASQFPSGKSSEETEESNSEAA